MSYKTHHDVQSPSRAVRIVAGRFRPNGSSAVSNTTANKIALRNVTVTRTDVGTYTLAISPSYYRILAAAFQVHHATPDDYKVCGDHAPAGNSVKIAVFDGAGAAVDIASNVDNWISVVIVAQDTSVSP